MPGKKKSANSGRRQCATKGCRKMRASNSEFCVKCRGSEPVDMAVKVTEVEALRFARLDAELRNNMQGVELLRFRIQDVSREKSRAIAGLEAEIKHLQSLAATMRPEYNGLVTAIAEKYGISDPAHMTIDPDTMIVRDLTKQ